MFMPNIQMILSNMKLKKMKIENEINKSRQASPSKAQQLQELELQRMKEKELQIQEQKIENEMKISQEIQKLQRQEEYEEERIKLEKELNQSKQKILLDEIDNQRIQQFKQSQIQRMAEEEFSPKPQRQYRIPDKPNIEYPNRKYEFFREQQINDLKQLKKQEQSVKAIRKSGQMENSQEKKIFSRHQTPSKANTSSNNQKRYTSEKKTVSTKALQTYSEKFRPQSKQTSAQKSLSNSQLYRESHQKLVNQSQQRPGLQPHPNGSSQKRNQPKDEKQLNFSQQKNLIEPTVTRSNNKYSNFKAQIRGQMAVEKDKYNEEPSYSQIQPSLSSSKANSRQQTPSKQSRGNKSNKKVPQSYTKLPIGNSAKATSSNTGNNNNPHNNPSNQKVRSSHKNGIPKEVIQEIQISPFKNYNKSTNKQKLDFEVTQNRTQIMKYLNQELMEMIQQIIFQEKKIERSKEDLALRPDFNLLDCYGYIDSSGRGVVSSVILEKFLKELQIECDLQDIFLFMRRFGSKNSKVSFQDFAECLTPKQKEYATILNNREVSQPNFTLSLVEIYSNETIKLMKQLFKNLLEAEHVVEEIRLNFSKNKQLNYQDIFNLLDYDEDGFISPKEVQYFFQKNGQICTDKEVLFFISRFDLDKDDLISFGEFVQEFSPKTTQ
eukprot:TRINITY_DN2338_c0_g1_i3.p1 TRINITY_DN2338_c0_g1~~TRINITY_DN2338_c0_g1_i3.p1  ORF type:complete len:661 (+),score=140.53 TRINITY_DN2338_c0_g1_i3:305-2287(+)